MSFDSASFKAGGDIRPNRFVKPSTAADNRLLEADANEMTIGISQENTRDAPVDGASALAAASGDPIGHAPIGSYPILEINDTVTHGALLKSDADGLGVLAAVTGPTMQWVGAIALQSGSAGELIRVLVVSFPWYPALS